VKNTLKQHPSKLYIVPILPIPSVVDYVIVSPVVVSYQPQFFNNGNVFALFVVVRQIGKKLKLLLNWE